MTIFYQGTHQFALRASQPQMDLNTNIERNFTANKHFSKNQNLTNGLDVGA